MTVQQPHLSHLKYRPDIDGLRAVAVLAVVAFHAFPNWVRGGFIGVDVFFVISGYLISTIIFENLDKGTFSFAEFYSRRIRRIFPALLLVLIACFAFGWFALLADEYKQLGKHIAAGAGFISNFTLWNEAGYFDNSAETKPLLHLWSLAIEEQFYIVWPLLLWFAWKRKFNLLTIAIVVAIASFILNIKGVKHDMVATFYSPQTRFWELLSGSLLAWIALYKKDTFANIKHKVDLWLSRIVYSEKQGADGKTLSNVLSFIGLLLLVYGFWRINKELSFPGKWALVPVLGVVLIITAGSKAWVNRTILSNKVAVWFGLISYPLYLWHWPILSFARIVESEVPSRNIRIAAVALSIALAWFTYKLVERPLRFGKHSKAKVAVLVVLMAVVGYVGYNNFSRNGLPFREFNKKLITYSESIKVPNRAKECFEIPYAYKKNGDWFCNLGDISSPVEYFAYGDSHALSLIPALEEFSIESKLRIQFTGASGCPSLLGIQSIRGESGIEMYNCKELNERIFNYVKTSGIKTVILANRWTYYVDSLSRPAEFNAIARDLSLPIDKASSTRDLLWAVENTVSRYSSIGVKVIFVEDNPQQIYEPKDVLRKGRGNESYYLKMSVSTDEHIRNQKLVNDALRSSGAKVIKLDDILCNETICPRVANSKFLYSDDDHLSVAGSIFISKDLSTRLKQ
jgi:peptidoglycan/LPS O-acetylase OafA/YrhL